MEQLGIGSSFDDFLKEEKIFENTKTIALERVKAFVNTLEVQLKSEINKNFELRQEKEALEDELSELKIILGGYK